MKNNIFVVGIVSLAFLLHGFFNIDILLPALAFVIFLNRKNLANITISMLIAYSFVGSFVWLKELVPALVATLFVAFGILGAFVIFKYSEKLKTTLSWGMKLIAVVAYDNLASLPIFYSAFMTGGFAKLWLQVVAGIPFTVRHLVSFLAFYGLLRVINKVVVRNAKLAPAIN